MALCIGAGGPQVARLEVVARAQAGVEAEAEAVVVVVVGGEAEVADDGDLGEDVEGDVGEVEEEADDAADAELEAVVGAAAAVALEEADAGAEVDRDDEALPLLDDPGMEEVV